MNHSKENILILAASHKHHLISNLTANYLSNKGHLLYTFSELLVFDNAIHLYKEIDHNQQIDTLCVFLQPKKQIPFYDKILSLNLKKIIFTPGTENQELEHLAQKQNINIIRGCAIALYSMGFLKK